MYLVYNLWFQKLGDDLDLVPVFVHSIQNPYYSCRQNGILNLAINLKVLNLVSNTIGESN